MLTRKNLFYLIILSFYIWSCASIGSPEGGPKDEKPPVLVQSTPKNRALQVTSKVITLEFDEEIQLKDINRQLLITPSLNNPFTAIAKKNTLVLEFEKSLEQNTTYFINFRGGVVDLTESNKPTDLSLTFSTGSYIDSGKVAGNVRDLYTNAVEKSVNVLLYAAHDTTTIRKHRPYYYAQTDDKGNFLLQNLKEGEYRIYAHNDRNNNLIYDNEAEKIAYKAGVIKINSSTPDVELLTLKVDTKKPIVESSTRFADEYRVTFNEGLTNINAVPLTEPANTAAIISLIDETKPSNATLYPTAKVAPNKYIISATDSAGNTKIDTVQIAFDGKKAPRDQDAFEVKTFNGQINKDEPLHLRFQTPLKIVDSKAAITIVEDTIRRKPLSYPQDFKLNDKATEITFTESAKAVKNLEIVLDTTKIVPVSGTPFNKQIARFDVTNKILVGSLLGNISTKYKRYWVEILNKEGKIAYRLDSPKALKLDKLEPNTYTIRVKIDEDNDGLWRAGNKDLTTPPEKIYHYPKPFEIRANWELLPDPPISF